MRTASKAVDSENRSLHRIYAIWHFSVIISEKLIVCQMANRIEVCDISQGPIQIVNHWLKCNGKNWSTPQRVVVTGESSNNGIHIQDATVDIQLRNVFIHTETAFLCSNSSVSVILEGSNSLKSTSKGFAGLGCEQHSRVSITGTETATLHTKSFKNAAGIGAGQSGKCDLLAILGGSITAVGGPSGAGIGGGPSSHVAQIRISKATVHATGGSKAAGIGAGFPKSKVGTVTISHSTVIAIGG
jgi:hypothetical protein